VRRPQRSQGRPAPRLVSSGSGRTLDDLYPFILRNVALLGINSVRPPKPLRFFAWERLAREPLLGKLQTIATIEPLSGIKPLAERLLEGQVRGRIVVDVNA